VIVVGSGIEVFLVKVIFLDGLVCSLPVFLSNVETSQKVHSNIRLQRGKRYDTEQRTDCNSNFVFTRSLIFHICVCMISINEKSVI
jgi:hypothetical protein